MPFTTTILVPVRSNRQHYSVFCWLSSPRTSMAPQDMHSPSSISSSSIHSVGKGVLQSPASSHNIFSGSFSLAEEWFSIKSRSWWKRKIVVTIHVSSHLVMLPATYLYASRIKLKYHPYLSLQSDYVLSSVDHTHNLLKKLSHNQEHTININLFNNFHTIIIGNSTVTLSRIGVMFYTLLDFIKEWRKSLLMGIDLEEQTLVDELDNLTPGFYFGNIPWNKLKCYEQTLTKLIFGHPGMSGKFILDHLNCCKFLEESASIHSALGTLLHICTSGPYWVLSMWLPASRTQRMGIFETSWLYLECSALSQIIIKHPSVSLP